MLIYFGIIAGILMAEILIKQWIKHRENKGDTSKPEWKGIRIEHLENGGAATGLFSDHKTTLKVITGGILSILCVRLGKEYHRKSFSAYGLGLALILGGGLSNLMDRIRKGTVTDYIRFVKCPVKRIVRVIVKKILNVGFFVLQSIFGATIFAHETGLPLCIFHIAAALSAF